MFNIKNYSTDHSDIKLSKIEGLKSLPKHWDQIKIGYLILYTKGFAFRSSKFKNSGIGIIKVTNLKKDSIILKNISYLSPEEASNYSKYKIIENDIIITTVGSHPSVLKSAVGKAFLVPKSADGMLLNQNTVIVRSKDNKKLSQIFLFYYLKNNHFWQYILSTVGGSANQSSIKIKDIFSFYITLPSIKEQIKIENFLKKQLFKLDNIVIKKRKLIILLQEKRQTLITQAVIKGLSPNTPMKDSGIEWLGEIPKHWDRVRIKYLVKDKLQYGANETGEIENLGLRYIRITDFDNNGKLLTENKRFLSLNKGKSYLLKKGDILFARSGATVGKAFYYSEDNKPACFAGYLIKATCNPTKCFPLYLYYFTSSFSYENWKKSIYSQATIQNISAQKYNQLIIPLPPLKEQNEIINYITKETRIIDYLIKKIKSQVNLIEEYHQILVTNAVTGIINVRGLT